MLCQWSASMHKYIWFSYSILHKSHQSRNLGELKPPKPPWYLHLEMASEAISEHLISKISWYLSPHTLLYSFACYTPHTHVTPLLEILAMGLMTFFSFCFEGVLGWYYLLTTHAAVGIYHIIRLRENSFFFCFAFSFVCLFVCFSFLWKLCLQYTK